MNRKNIAYMKILISDIFYHNFRDFDYIINRQNFIKIGFKFGHEDYITDWVFLKNGKRELQELQLYNTWCNMWCIRYAWTRTCLTQNQLTNYITFYK